MIFNKSVGPDNPVYIAKVELKDIIYGKYVNRNYTYVAVDSPQ